MAFQNTLERFKPRHSSRPLSNTNGIINRHRKAGAEDAGETRADASMGGPSNDFMAIESRVESYRTAAWRILANPFAKACRRQSRPSREKEHSNHHFSNVRHASLSLEAVCSLSLMRFWNALL